MVHCSPESVASVGGRRRGGIGQRESQGFREDSRACMSGNLQTLLLESVYTNSCLALIAW